MLKTSPTNRPRGKAVSSKGRPASLVSVGQDDPGQCLRGEVKATSSLDRPTPEVQRVRQLHRPMGVIPPQWAYRAEHQDKRILLKARD